MSELPTKEELEQLYREKGHDALVWYAWRCALRVSPAFGQLALNEAWPKNTIGNIYTVCRSYFILAQWATHPELISTYAAHAESYNTEVMRHYDQDYINPIYGFDKYDIGPAPTFTMHGTDTDNSEAYRAYIEKYDAEACETISDEESGFRTHSNIEAYAADSYTEHTKYASEVDSYAYSNSISEVCSTALLKNATASNDIIKSAIKVIAKAVNVANSDCLSIFTTVANSALGAASGAASCCATAAADASPMANKADAASNIASTVRAAAANDYELLIRQEVFDSTFWFSHPIWPTIPKNNTLNVFQQNLLHLFDDLNALELGFLADDLQSILEMKPLGLHARNYLKNLSDTVINDPVALQEAILGGSNASENLQTVRVLLLGPGGAGKSSLRDRLLDRPVENSLNKEATTGIEYEWLDKTVLRKINPKLKLNSQLKLRLWDFGGQTIFHGLHRAFLHENCVYVLVVDSRHEQAPDNWLYQIQDLTGNEKPQVLIVTNRYEHCDTRQNEVRLLREFPDLLGSQEQFFYFSCHQSNEPQFKAFIQALIDQSMNSRHQVLKLAMDVQRKMKVDFKDQTFLRKNRIKSLIPSHLVEEFHGTIVNHLDQLGYMIPVEKGEMIYCLKPEWAVKNAYNLVHSKALRDKDGIAPTDVLEETLEDKVGGTEIDYLIRFLHSRHLCQKLSNNKYFFPDSAPANEPTVVRELQETENRLELRFDLPFLPLGIHTRFISQLFHNNDDVTISEAGAIWRQGFILQSGDAKASVQYQWRKSCIEITMAGDVERFADILNAFHNALNFVLKSGYLKEADVQPYVVYGSGQIYSIHSSAALADKLREITRIEELFPKVQAMAAEKVINISEGGTYNEGGDSSQFATNSENFTQNNQPQTLSVNEQETLQDVIKALRDNLDSFETEQQIAVLQTQKALESPQDEKSVQLLGKAYQGLLKNVDGLATFTKDKAIPITDFAIKNKESLAAAATALTVALGA